jgi:hypothetical protein
MKKILVLKFTKAYSIINIDKEFQLELKERRSTTTTRSNNKIELIMKNERREEQKKRLLNKTYQINN